MFEVPKEKPQGGTKLLWVALIVVALVAIVGGGLYLRQKPEPPAAASAPALDLSQAKPQEDMKVNSATMSRDPTGTRAVWTVQVQNNSPYTYREVQYETTYVDAAERVIATNKGTLPGSVGPNQQRTISEMQDILYPQGTASYRFRLTGATPAVE